MGAKSRASIPEAMRRALRTRLEAHAAARWADRCRSIAVRFRGAYAYIDAFASEELRGEGDSEIPIHLCRLGYLGHPDRWTFAFLKYSDEVYEPSVVLSGALEATPEEAFDCAATVYLST